MVDSCPFMLEIGNHVRITAGVTLLCHDASFAVFEGAKEKYPPVYRKFKKTKIGNNVFIGRNAIILMGSDVGDNVIIGAGSIVSGRLENDSVYAGNPAKKICSLQEYYEKCKCQYIKSAQDYLTQYSKYLGRTPKLSEIDRGYLELFEQEARFPHFDNIEDLLRYTEA